MKAESKRLKSLKLHMKQYWMLYAMLSPMVVFFLVFNYYPMLGLQLAFKDWNMRLGIWGSPWATTDGQLDLFKHFRVLFDDPKVTVKFLNTLRISSLKLLIGFPIPIIITLLLNEMTSKSLKKVTQTISYLPYFISWVIMAGILLSMTATGGAFQNTMAKIFGKPIPFFGDDNLFVGLVIVSDIWKNAGWNTVIYFAALTSIAPELYEAAKIDGAGRFQCMRYITLPGMMTAISINLMFALSGIVYGGFDQIFNLYNTTVYGKGDILETYIYRNGVTDGIYDLSTALGLFNSLIAFVLITIANFVSRKLGGTYLW